MPRTYPSYAFGRRLLSDTLSDLSSSQPDRVYASVPKTNDVGDGFLDISFQDMERMAVALTTWIKGAWGDSSTFETIAYIGVPDIRSAVIFFAAVRNGYKLFLPSPRNPVATNASLLEQTGCSKVIYANEVKAVIDQLLQVYQISTLAVASLHDVLRLPASTATMVKRLFEEAKHDPILILHSSGSTGLPKPITMTNASFAVLDNERFLPGVEGRIKRDFSIWDFEGGGKFFTVFPYFHLAGFLSLVVNPVFAEASSPVIGPATAPPSGALMKDILKQLKVRALYIPPSIAEQLLAEADGLDYFKQLDFICYTGGPFSSEAGKRLVEVTDLVPLYGSTEAFQTPQLVPQKEDWAYMEWNPHFKHEMQPAEDGAYELVLFSDASTEKRSALNYNVPGATVWRTRDLFKPHPSKPNLWSYFGRRDDIIVFSNGEKFNPVPMELMIGGSKLLNGVLVVGQGRTQASLLLEPKSGSEVGSKAAIDEVWPLVERSNVMAPAQGQITRSMVHVVPPTSLVRAGKGTVIRKLSEKKLQAEIDELYTERSPDPFLTSASAKSLIEKFVRGIIADAFSQNISLDEDLFAFGLDSLKATQIVRNLKAGIKPLTSSKLLNELNLGFVYRYSSPGQIADMVFNSPVSGTVPSIQTDHLPEEVAAAISDYTSGFMKRPTSVAREPTSKLTVALTGSNGSLGNALLQRLIQDPMIGGIYCLNRRHDAEHEANYASGVRYLKAQLHEDSLGLDEAEYDALSSDADIIIHNAWQVDFSLPLKVFRNQLRDVRNLVDWSLKSPRQPRIVFCSTVSSAMNWQVVDPTASTIPESICTDPRSALSTGYAISKFIAEQVLTTASQQCGSDVAILRLGQVVQSGDFALDSKRRGRSWIPGLFQTSKTLGCFPGDICDLDWLSLEEASAVVYELAMQKLGIPIGTEGILRVYNVVNPSPCSWASVSPQLQEVGLVPPDMIPLTEWITKLEGAASKEAIGRDTALPSSKLIPFFQALGNGTAGIRYETQQACLDSLALRSARPVDGQKVQSWANQ